MDNRTNSNQKGLLINTSHKSFNDILTKTDNLYKDFMNQIQISLDDGNSLIFNNLYYEGHKSSLRVFLKLNPEGKINNNFYLNWQKISNDIGVDTYTTFPNIADVKYLYQDAFCSVIESKIKKEDLSEFLIQLLDVLETCHFFYIEIQKESSQYLKIKSLLRDSDLYQLKQFSINIKTNELLPSPARDFLFQNEDCSSLLSKIKNLDFPDFK